MRESYAIRVCDDHRRSKIAPALSLTIAGLLLCLPASICQAQGSATSVRPILFVPALCGVGSDWSTLQGTIASDLVAGNPTLYSTPQLQYSLYYDGNTVRTWPDRGVFLSEGIPASTRFFSMTFFAEGALQTNSGVSKIDSSVVTGVSILNKADELAHVLQAITELTTVKDVIVVAHSMGGLVTRAYLQGLGSPYVAFCNDGDQYKSCSPGTTQIGRASCRE